MQHYLLPFSLTKNIRPIQKYKYLCKTGCKEYMHVNQIIKSGKFSNSFIKYNLTHKSYPTKHETVNRNSENPKKQDFNLISK